MARGESEAKQSHGAAVAIWSVFGVACLAVAWVVVRVTADPEVPDDPFGTSEPHPGIEGPLRGLSARGCGLASGPRMGGPAMPGPVDAKAHLERRGYVEAVSFGEPQTLPLIVPGDELEGACGVVAAVATTSGFVERTDVDGQTTLPCDHGVILTPVCGNEDVAIQGYGEARVGIYMMPGVLPDDSLPPDVVLAHAEAVTLLGASGWTPVPEAIRGSFTGGRLDDLPEHPSGGCVAYVVAGLGVGHVHGSWMGRMVGQGNAPDRFLTGAVVCEHSRRTEITGAVPGTGQVIVARPYRVEGGPSVPAARAAVPLTMLGAGDRLPMPPSLDDRGAP